MENGSDHPSRRLGQIIEEAREEIERRWLERVQQGIVKQPGVELTLLRDGMPDYLVELANVLRNGAVSIDARAESAWSVVAREHGITRVRIGFDISQLVHEFVVLRRIIEEIVRERAPQGDGTGAVLAELIEAAIATAVQAYVDARDYDARRAEAQNIGFLTHELLQPLASALLATARLRSRASAEQVPILEMVDRNLGRLNDLIDSVLLAQNLEAGEVQVKPAETTIGQLMESVETLRRKAEEKGLQFRVTFDPTLTVTLDPALTRSVVENLAGNAVKYTDSGEVEISVTDAGDDVVLDVRDTCKGLSQEELATIFEPFKRGRTDKSGTGLGLAIARRAVEAQGGEIRAESLGASGCHFSVRLPKHASNRHAAAHAASV
jgi:signal transduction histidine kinase